MPKLHQSTSLPYDPGQKESSWSADGALLSSSSSMMSMTVCRCECNISAISFKHEHFSSVHCRVEYESWKAKIEETKQTRYVVACSYQRPRVSLGNPCFWVLVDDFLPILLEVIVIRDWRIKFDERGSSAKIGKNNVSIWCKKDVARFQITMDPSMSLV